MNAISKGAIANVTKNTTVKLALNDYDIDVFERTIYFGKKFMKLAKQYGPWLRNQQEDTSLTIQQQLESISTKPVTSAVAFKSKVRTALSSYRLTNYEKNCVNMYAVGMCVGSL